MTYASCQRSINSVDPDCPAAAGEASATGAETAKVASMEVTMMLKNCILKSVMESCNVFDIVFGAACVGIDVELM